MEIENNSRGFTLVELLIVIAIAAIIAGAMVPLFQTTRVDVKMTRILTEVDAIKTTFENYKFDNGSYPPGVSNKPLEDIVPLKNYIAADGSGNIVYYAESDAGYYLVDVFTDSATAENWLATMWYQNGARTWQVNGDHAWGGVFYNLLLSKSEDATLM